MNCFSYFAQTQSMAVVVVLMLKQNWFLFTNIYQAILQLRALNEMFILGV